MLHRILRLFVTALCSVVLLALCTTTAEAKGAGAGRVTGVARAGQSWAHSKLKVRWKAVRGASAYQVRASVARKNLKKNRGKVSHSPRGTYIRKLNRNRAYFVQVRAIKNHKPLAWSAVKRFRFVRPGRHVSTTGSHGSSRTVYGMNVSPGSSYTNGARESAAQQVSRIRGTYGTLGAAKVFYQGALPATFNRNYEGLIPGKVAAVCFKPSQTALANGSLDASIKRYVDSIPAGWKIMLVNWQEPDDEIWKTHQFSAAQHRRATEGLIDVVHSNPAYAQGRAEVWDVWMGFSIDVGRWQDSAASPRLDGIGWDYYWNTPTTSWHDNPAADLRRMANVTKRLGIKQWGLFETGDNPHANDDAGRGRAAFWKKVYASSDALGYSYLLYFNAIGTTGDHRIRPETSFGGPTAALLRSHM
ncbi:MAG TPA: hypothetical protein VFD59_01480 [Nocardioidaceae bacterium]|nr:hypothetical protein [Nocardioidaceae bacterium]